MSNKKIRHELKKYYLNSIAFMVLIFSICAYANENYKLPIEDGYVFTTISTNTILATGKDKTCIITKSTAEMGADPSLPPRLSHDGEYAILTEHDYIDKDALVSCTKKTKASSIKSLLIDINKAKKLILSADIYSLLPDGYLAEVYDIKTKKEAIIAEGFFNKKIPLKRQLKYVFIMPAGGIISKDGQYVSANGDLDCTNDAYPGVYNLKTGKKVNGASLGGLDGDALDEACKKLFQ